MTGLGSIVDRVADWALFAARGLQVHRKDKDLMQDTGGTSKGRDREPDLKPPRDDVKERYRDRRVPHRDVDEDTNENKDREVKKPNRRPQGADMGLAAGVVAVAREVLSSAAEEEVERLMRALLRGTPFSNKVHAVGGYVRDQVLGIPAKDLDLVVDMPGGAEKFTAFVYRSFPGKVSTPRRLGNYPIWVIAFKDDVEFGGEGYGVKGAEIEVADPQKESFPDEGSRQRITEPGTLREDAERRDFTVNTLMRDLTTGELLDLTGTSAEDIRKGILRGVPGVDFGEIIRADPLRMMRLVRFQAKYGWSVPLSVIRDVRKNAQRIRIVSGERVRDELVKIMDIGKLSQAVRFMKTLGLLGYVMPEIESLAETQHDTSRGIHQEGDVLRHTLLVLRNAKPGVESQLAALLHDVGKPQSREVIEGVVRFIGHEKVGGEIAEGIMRRLKFDNTTIRTVRKMVENHMRPHHLLHDKAGPQALRRFIRDVGDEMVGSILDLAEADALGTLPPANEIPDLRRMIEQAKVVPIAPKSVLDGNEIQRILGIGSGRLVGEAKQYLREVEDDKAAVGEILGKPEAERLLLERFSGAVAGGI